MAMNIRLKKYLWLALAVCAVYVGGAWTLRYAGDMPYVNAYQSGLVLVLVTVMALVAQPSHLRGWAKSLAWWVVIWHVIACVLATMTDWDLQNVPRQDAMTGLGLAAFWVTYVTTPIAIVFIAFLMRTRQSAQR